MNTNPSGSSINELGSWKYFSIAASEPNLWKSLGIRHEALCGEMAKREAVKASWPACLDWKSRASIAVPASPQVCTYNGDAVLTGATSAWKSSASAATEMLRASSMCFNLQGRRAVTAAATNPVLDWKLTAEAVNRKSPLER